MYLYSMYWSKRLGGAGDGWWVHTKTLKRKARSAARSIVESFVKGRGASDLHIWFADCFDSVTSGRPLFRLRSVWTDSKDRPERLRLTD